ncbi:hypothetical protein EXIGLDRAFT_479134 [Exidia glandulosa HHB12029]|uniref:C2H2-type domain-containing protein n=1 Tax=Exidia glandulosa HHB12029 TaxID=1314781 RepID=A0A166NHQ0_EXIGL|nr:hypothetical protein EXIGLDRAFT_479134 [Exidia glandulosa HHB12029]
MPKFCDRCNLSFSTKTVLNTHKYRAHTLVQNPPVASSHGCSCGCLFTSNERLEHMAATGSIVALPLGGQELLSDTGRRCMGGRALRYRCFLAFPRHYNRVFDFSPSQTSFHHSASFFLRLRLQPRLRAATS